MLAGALGSTVSGVWRLHYEVGGSFDESTGALELAFTHGLTVHLKGGSDGESLVVLSKAWVDPFVEPLSAENRAYVAECGKWTKVDKSASPGFGYLVGSTLRDYSTHVLEDGRLAGITMQFDDSVFVRAQCLGDELIVDTVG